MTRSQIFLGPGRWAVGFALSLLEMSPSDLAPELFKALSVATTLVFWYVVIKVLVNIVIAVLRRVTGFDRQGPQR